LQYIKDSWAIIFSHPKDYTPGKDLHLLHTPLPFAVCTTELGEAAVRAEEFTSRGVKMIALSCDSVEDHEVRAPA
jgi:1-Cys peroxiredoxin 6